MPEKKQDQPRSVGSFWKIIREPSAIGGITFFLLIALEWSYVSGFYETLGAKELSRRMLETAPGKYGIGTFAIDFLISLSIAPIVGIAVGDFLLQKSIQLNLYEKLDKGLARYMPYFYSDLRLLLQIGALLLMINIIATYCDIPSLIQIVILSMIVYLGMHWANRCPQHHWGRWAMYVIVDLIAAFLIWSISLFIYQDGQKAAVRVLTGETPLPGVAIITNAPLPVSPAVDVDRGYNWRYYPREVPNTDSLVFSLQYVGEDENAVYILDYVARRVIVVPREEIHSMVLFPTAAFRRGVPMIVDPRVSTPIQHATFSPLLMPSPSSSGR